MKDRIVATAFRSFALYGIKIVSMDQIANEMQISKKTLYVNFQSKEDLVCACLDLMIEQVRLLLNKVDEEIENPVWKVIYMTSDLFQYHSYFCPSFYRDLYCYQHAISKKNHGIELVINKYSHYLQIGQDEGYFLNDIDTEMFATIILDELPKWGVSYQQIAAFTLLRGICTYKGRNVLKQFAPELTGAMEDKFN